jgi:hypothetical protein
METKKLRPFVIHFKSGDPVITYASSFEVDYKIAGKVITFYNESHETVCVHVDSKQVVAIVPNEYDEIDEHSQQFHIYLSGDDLITIPAHHFVRWTGEVISFRDAENKHIPDIYVSLKDVLAIVPVGESVPAEPTQTEK